MLKIELRKATGLRAMDNNGKSDPYVVVKANGKNARSKVIKETVDPEWNQTLELMGTVRDFVDGGLKLELFDWDAPYKKLLKRSDDPLGKLDLKLDWLRTDDVHEYSEALPSPGKGSIAFTVAFEALRPQMFEEGRLFICLSHATGLMSADSNGLSDPYCKLAIGDKKYKSKTIKKTLDPTWGRRLSSRACCASSSPSRGSSSSAGTGTAPSPRTTRSARCR